MIKMPPKLWQCHKCGHGPYTYANATRCVNCNHDYCGSCKTNGNIPSTMKASDGFRRRIKSSQSKHTDQIQAALYGIEPSTGYNTSPSPAKSIDKSHFRLKVRPSMAGWWKCHECKYVNNPALNPKRCLECSHTKCSYCTIRGH